MKGNQCVSVYLLRQINLGCGGTNAHLMSYRYVHCIIFATTATKIRCRSMNWLLLHNENNPHYVVVARRQSEEGVR